MKKKFREKNGKVFATFFPQFENIHVTKEVGYIPYILHRDYGYSSYILCYQNGQYDNLDKELPGLKLLFIKRGIGHFIRKSLQVFTKNDNIPLRGVESLCIVIDALPILLKYGKDFDVLQVYHLDDKSILMSWLYRLINRNGIVYLKLDMDPVMCTSDDGRRRSFFYRKAPIDIMSIETKDVLDFMKNKHSFFRLFRDNLYYMPSGIDIKTMVEYRDELIPKEKTILHVGRIGTHQKASELVLDVFAEVSREYPDWDLKLIGSMEDDFPRHYHHFLEQNKDLVDKISYMGIISSRKDLYNEYKKAKILALPSRFESFGLVVAEAGFFRTVTLASDILPVRNMTDGGKLSYLCPVDNSKCFADTLRHMISHDDELAKKASEMPGFISSNFDWNVICGHLNDHILQKMKDKSS
jgi:glycosyltransferase involved in cell wall biosynthesis